jgi:hypothetical protein
MAGRVIRLMAPFGINDRSVRTSGSGWRATWMA